MSFKEQCNDYVNQIEDDYVNDLFEQHQRASMSAEGCGCPQCKKKPHTIDSKIAKEIDRISPKTGRVDHEEWILFVLAVNKAKKSDKSED